MYTARRRRTGICLGVDGPSVFLELILACNTLHDKQHIQHVTQHLRFQRGDNNSVILRTVKTIRRGEQLMSPQCHVGLFLTCVVTETSQRDRNERGFAGGGDVRLKLCCSFRNKIQSRKCYASFLFAFVQRFIHRKSKKSRMTFSSSLYVITIMSGD